MNHFESPENLIEKTRSEFKRTKEENFDKEKRGETVDANLKGILPEEIGEEEARLWLEVKAAGSEKDLNAVEGKFNEYRDRINELFVVKAAREGKEADIAALLKDSRQSFVGFLGTTITKKQLEIYRKKLKKAR